MIKWVVFDADDTLWHNEIYYVRAKEKLAAVLMPYLDGTAGLDHIEAILDQHEAGNLAYFGYGIKSFTLSMIEAAITLTGGRISGEDVAAITAIARHMIDTPVELLENVPSTLDDLSGDYTLAVITKGDLLDQERKVERSGLGEYFQQVAVVSHKTPESYLRVLQGWNLEPSHALMVGNSLRSDVLPFVEVGGQAVHIPYHITWSHEHVAPHLAQTADYHTLDHIGLLPELVRELKR